MKEIILTRGKASKVDEEDYDFLMQWNWTANYSKGKWYARKHLGNRKYVSMHKVLLDSSIDVDHKDGDGLNNQRHNLRVCTHIQNMQNSVIKSNNTSGYKGVHLRKKDGKWQARIVVNGKRMYLGAFDFIEDAARSYDQKAKEMFGEFAKTNF